MKNKVKNRAELLTPGQVASTLGISRTAVHKRIKKKQIPAEKVGGNFYIPKNIVTFNKIATAKDCEIIVQGVKRVITDYKDTLKMLGKE